MMMMMTYSNSVSETERCDMLFTSEHAAATARKLDLTANERITKSQR